MSLSNGRRGFLERLLTAGGLAAAPMGALAQQGGRQRGDAGEGLRFLPRYARAQNHKSLKQSSFDRTGGNRDFWTIPAGGLQEVFRAEGPGVISHIWFTIAARGADHLKELVFRGYWDGNSKPSIETPIGDFFGLNLGSYQIYESEYLACSPGKSLNCYFAMPYRTSARLTVTNEGKQEVGAFYSNIDYMTVPGLPGDAMYFHAQYRQSAPCVPSAGEAAKLNADGRLNYVYVETRGQGHLMGVTLGVLQNAVYVHVRASAVFGVGVLIVGWLLLRHRAELPGVARLGAFLLGILVVQMAVGEIQYRTHLPWWLVLVHVGLAAAVWGATVVLVTSIWRPPAPLTAH